MRSSLKIPAIIAIGSSLVLAGCAATEDPGTGAASGAEGSGAILMGTTDQVTSLDPAGSYDNGSFAVAINIYPYLLTIKPGGNTLEGDIAESFEFVDDSTYQVTLKSGLKFANGHDLTSSDVKASFDRMLAIDDPNGPQSLLANLEETVAVDDTTVQFKLKSPNDQTFPQVLTTPAGPILDEEVFPADKLATSDEIVAANAFGGPYAITNYQENSLITYKANPEYQGLHVPQNSSVSVSYLTDETNLKQQVENGDIDVAYRSLAPTAIEDLRSNDAVTVHEGPGGEARFIVFNTDIMPFGNETDSADPAKALAVRQAIASVIDREAIATTVYKNTYSPSYSAVPESMEGATTPFKQYGDGNGGPDTDKAAQILADAGVETPVALPLQYNPDHYGQSSADEYAAIKDQLESSGLFTVDLQSTSWTTYSDERLESYPVYQLGWFPDFSDADNYLSPFFGENNFVHSWDSGLSDEIKQMIKEEPVTADPEERLQVIADLQDLVAEDALLIPLLTGKQIAVAGTDVQGITLDASFKFYYAGLTK